MFSLLEKKAARLPENIAGVRVKSSTRARRMALQVDVRAGDVVLTLPPRVSLKRAQKFIDDNRHWIERQRRKNAEAEKILPGGIISFLGDLYTVEHRQGRGVSHIDGSVIVIRGGAEYFPRRCRDFLKQEAAKALEVLVREKTAELGMDFAGLRVIDPRTRWGSCAPDGQIMLSWRLALAPPDVTDYVVAHEVAHRKYMNHGPRFWALCARLTYAEVESAKRWLRVHGEKLMGCV